MKNNNYSLSKIEKIGNTIIYISKNYKGNLFKFPLLYLIYLLEESSIKSNGVPLFNVDFKIWDYGPIFADLYVEISKGLDHFKPYFNVYENNFGTYVKSDLEFSDEEFSDNDMELLDSVIKLYHNYSTIELSKTVCSSDRPWYIQANKHKLLSKDGMLVSKTSDITIDFNEILNKDSLQYFMYQMSKESDRAFNSLNP